MLFNSIQFVYFLPIVVLLYFIFPSKKRWLILLVSSYYFYASWNVEYLLLIIFTTFLSYYSAIFISENNNFFWKKFYLIFSITICISILFFFKYYNFFSYNLNNVINIFNLQIPYSNFLLPVGISFYTFQTLSYIIDVFYNKQTVEKHFGIYALYVSFFPQLVAGPIERSYRLLPQFRVTHSFSLDNLLIGLRWIILGFFMKLVVADRLSIYVDSIYSNPFSHSGITLLVATIFFSFQIYCDFAGYSNIAIGTAKILGYDLMVNFKRPYFSKSFSDFWNRWHISLSTWFRDYFYIPLGGNRVTKVRNFVNISATFLISGLWHGANWTFVVWGGLHAIYLIIESIINFGISQKDLKIIKLVKILFIFILVNIAWIFFRADNVTEGIHICKKIIFDKGPLFFNAKVMFFSILGILLLITNDLIEEFYFKGESLKSSNSQFSSIYYAILFCFILFLGVFNGGQFIYFQF